MGRRLAACGDSLSGGLSALTDPGIDHAAQSFGVLKFRTMYAPASDAVGGQQAMRNDPRVIRVGAWLRRRSIDELPQLVWPRPHALGVKGGLFHEAVNRYAARDRVKAGIRSTVCAARPT
jgi:lipopolysaccharide/colanic/teichoic acid biosynthesis glycosyltransferase